jgi:hypothetical protein
MEIAAGNRWWTDPSHRIPLTEDLGTFPSIDRTSHKFNLNERQHQAFEEHAYRLLQYYCNTDESGTSRLKQRCSILAGM